MYILVPKRRSGTALVYYDIPFAENLRNQLFLCDIIIYVIYSSEEVFISDNCRQHRPLRHSAAH